MTTLYYQHCHIPLKAGCPRPHTLSDVTHDVTMSPMVTSWLRDGDWLRQESRRATLTAGHWTRKTGPSCVNTSTEKWSQFFTRHSVVLMAFCLSNSLHSVDS